MKIAYRTSPESGLIFMRQALCPGVLPARSGERRRRDLIEINKPIDFRSQKMYINCIFIKDVRRMHP